VKNGIEMDFTVTIFQKLKALKNYKLQAGHQWLTPVILATGDAEIRRITGYGLKPAQGNSS
jgi:hypothetical protein